jgi:hypothetical protein
MDYQTAELFAAMSGELVARLGRRWRQEIEAKVLPSHTTLQAALNKLPAPWIDGICVCLGMPVQGTRREKVASIVFYLTQVASLRSTIERLPSECRYALEYVLQQGGQVKYGELSRRFGDEIGDGWWWNEKPPHSTLGQLRLRGLLFVGRTPIAGRLYKVAIIPQELRGLIVDALSGSKPAQPVKEPAKAQRSKFYHALGAQLGALKFHYAIFATEDESLVEFYRQFMSCFGKAERPHFGGAEGFAEEEYLWNFRLPGTNKFLIDYYLERHGKPKGFGDKMLNWRGAQLRYCRILTAKDLLVVEDLETRERMACICLNIGGVKEYRRAVGDAVIGYVSPWDEDTYCLMGYSVTVPIIGATLAFYQALKRTLREVTAETEAYFAERAKKGNRKSTEIPEVFRKAFKE